MEYYTYWTVNDAPSNSTQPHSIFLWIFIISLITFLLVWKFKIEDDDKKFYLYASGLFALLAVPGYIYMKFVGGNPNEERLDKYLSDKKIKNITGQISNFRQAQSGRQTYEEFYVDSIKFNYLHNTLYEFANFGGDHSKVLHDGLNIRINYIEGYKGNEIQKFEIAK
ncbi:MAG: hypothetical protein K0M63_07610 [Weeksellaceae bacterium]|nr:hypothetical protein [Weeksellaceae bacterium]